MLKNISKIKDKEYKDSSKKLKYICSCGREAESYWGNFSRYGRCKKCSAIAGGKKKKFSQKYVKQFFKDQGCILLSQYEEANGVMEYICECGNKDRITFAHFKDGQRCRICKYEKIGKKMKLRVGSLNPRWNPDREVIKLNKLIQTKFRSMVSNVMAATNQKKVCKSSELLGYTRVELKNYLLNHPDWNKVKDTRWSIDHIYPIKAFVKYGITDLKLINCLENLQPMSLVENMSKHDKYDKEKFLKWLASKGIIIS